MYGSAIYRLPMFGLALLRFGGVGLFFMPFFIFLFLFYSNLMFSFVSNERVRRNLIECLVMKDG